MVLLTEQEQIDILRNKCDNVKNRLWIASPYIGTLKDVQRIIGGKWQLPSVDCRVLTDADSGFIRKDTFDDFISNQIQIRSLDSLHAKIYIVDDWCLVTSANLILSRTMILQQYAANIQNTVPNIRRCAPVETGNIPKDKNTLNSIKSILEFSSCLFMTSHIQTAANIYATTHRGL